MAKRGKMEQEHIEALGDYVPTFGPDATRAFELHIDGKRLAALDQMTKAQEEVAKAQAAAQNARIEYEKWVNLATAYYEATGTNPARNRNTPYECAARGHRPVDGQTLNGKCACGAFPEPS